MLLPPFPDAQTKTEPRPRLPCAQTEKVTKLNEGRQGSQALDEEKIKINRAESNIYRRGVMLF